MAEIHHFTYGWFNPVVAFMLAFLGSLLGLLCTARSRAAKGQRRQGRWLLIAAVSIGGAGIWLMHFMAMLGFDLPHSVVRLDPTFTVASLVLAVIPVAIGLFLVVRGAATRRRILCAGAFTGLGILAMHYTGMAGMRVPGTMHFDPMLVCASAAVAVLAATAALWFATAVRGWAPTVMASTVMGVAICGMHYTGMAALRIRLSPDPGEVTGISPFLLIVPITVLSAAALIAMAISALQTITEEEFDGVMSGRHRGAHGGLAGAEGPTCPVVLVAGADPVRMSGSDGGVREVLRGTPTMGMPVVTPMVPRVRGRRDGVAGTF